MEKEKTPLTILWLDDHFSFENFESTSPALGIIEFEQNFKVEMIFEHTLDPDKYYDQYKNPTERFLDKVKELTAKIGDDQIDIVVVGNNLGSGLLKAEAINCMKTEFTIVVHSMTIDEGPYRKMGFSNFCDRNDLGKKLLEITKIYSTSLA